MRDLELSSLDTPALLIDLDIVARNLAWMQDKADIHGVSLRPHVKTHKIPELAHMQIGLGARGITAAKVSEAEVMAEAGIKDIFIANQLVTESKLQRVIALAEKTRISLGLDSVAGARRLSAIATTAGVTIDYLIEIDTGQHRCGVLPGEPAIELFKMVHELPGIRFGGIFTHAGQVYGATSLGKIEELSRWESRQMAATASGFRDLGFTPEFVSVGSTPTMKVWQGHDGINEIRPGNYIFNDAIQVVLGVAKPEDCALTVLATVISQPDKRRTVIDAGSKVLALDKGAHGKEMTRGFGMVTGKNCVLERLSEEHGVISHNPGEDLHVGANVRIIPNHACAVVNLFDRAYGITGGRVEEEFVIAARGKVQ